MEKILEEMDYYLESLRDAKSLSDSENSIEKNLYDFVFLLKVQILQHLQENKEMIMISRRDADNLYRTLSRNKNILDLRSQKILGELLEALKGER